MTREQQRQLKAEKKAAKLAAKEEKRQEHKDAKAWNKMVNLAKSKGAWIEENQLQ